MSARRGKSRLSDVVKPGAPISRVRGLLLALLIFEVVRLIGWLILSWRLWGLDESEDRSNELFALAHMGGTYLGFPYSWPGALLLDVFDLLPNTPLEVVLVYGIFWCLGVSLVLVTFGGRRRKRQQKSNNSG